MSSELEMYLSDAWALKLETLLQDARFDTGIGGCWRGANLGLRIEPYAPAGESVEPHVVLLMAHVFPTAAEPGVLTPRPDELEGIRLSLWIDDRSRPAWSVTLNRQGIAWIPEAPVDRQAQIWVETGSHDLEALAVTMPERDPEMASGVSRELVGAAASDAAVPDVEASAAETGDFPVYRHLEEDGAEKFRVDFLNEEGDFHLEVLADAHQERPPKTIEAIAVRVETGERARFTIALRQARGRLIGRLSEAEMRLEAGVRYDWTFTPLYG